jgi:hypothetical protein
MSGQTPYFVILFKSVSYALKAEKILKQEGLPHKLIPVPKQISSDCGVCLRFEPQYRAPIETCLCKKVEIEDIRLLAN